MGNNKNIPVVILTRETMYDGLCTGCYKPIAAPYRYAFAHTWERKKEVNIRVYPACDQCADIDESIANAVSDGIRFSLVGVFPKAGVYVEYEEHNLVPFNAERCACGAATIGIKARMYDWERFKMCPRCWKDIRFLDKALSRSKLISSALKELRSEIRLIRKQSKEKEI